VVIGNKSSNEKLLVFFLGGFGSMLLI